MAAETQLKDAPVADEVKVSESAGQIQKKVQLDLDDAPFLQQEKQEDALAVQKENSSGHSLSEGGEENAAPKPKIGRKKLLILAGAAGVLLIAGLGAVWWFLLRTPPPHPSDAVKPEVIVVPSKPAMQVTPDYTKDFSPFLVFHSEGRSNGRFLICKFVTLTKVPNLDREMEQKMIPLRDAIYYYLRSKTPEYLTNAGNVSAIKQDLTAVINNYLSLGQIEDILFESYQSE